jgi:hypothetical protein
MNIFVLGSKPDAVFPDVQPERVYAVNGAIARLDAFSDASELVGVIAWSVIYSSKRQDVETRRQWIGRRVDRLIVAGQGANFKQEAPGLETKLQNLGLHFGRLSLVGSQYAKTIIKSRSKSRLLKEIATRLRSAGSGSLLLELKRTKLLPEAGISGGVRTLVIANEEAPPSARLYLIGVGARRSRGHFYDPDSLFDKHALQDRNFLIDFSRRNPGRLVATDPVLSRFLKRHAAT